MRKILTTLFIAFFILNAAAQKNAIPDDEMERWLREQKIPALGLGIIENGKIKEVKVFGVLKEGIKAPKNTLFNVASLTKPVVAYTVLKLVSEGKWSLDEPLDKYWIDPDLAADPRHKKLTTRLILTHQTGFPNWRWQTADSKLAFQFDPGTKYQYSGEGFEYLRNALEAKFKMTLDQLVAKEVFNPLGMNDTRFFWDASVDENRFAQWFDSKGEMYPLSKNTSANAADDLITTVADYAKFLIAATAGKGLSKAIYQDMISHQLKTKENKYFGLGWEVYDVGNGESVIAHGGADKGVRTQVLMLPKTNSGIIIFTNIDDGYKVYERLASTYLGDAGDKIIAIEMK